jgi:hypothetical protein
MRGDLTELKLEEARFFLEHLKPNYGKEKKFDFYLSAFISAARAVGWVMKAEYVHVEGWQAWRETRPASEEERALIKGTTLLRNRTNKVGPPQTMTTTVERIYAPQEFFDIINAALAASPDGRVGVHIGGTPGNYYAEFDVGDSVLRMPADGVVIKRSLEEFPDRNILEVCQAYYEHLAHLVVECRERFDEI